VFPHRRYARTLCQSVRQTDVLTDHTHADTIRFHALIREAATHFMRRRNVAGLCSLLEFMPPMAACGDLACDIYDALVAVEPLLGAGVDVTYDAEAYVMGGGVVLSVRTTPAVRTWVVVGASLMTFVCVWVGGVGGCGCCGRCACAMMTHVLACSQGSSEVSRARIMKQGRKDRQAAAEEGPVDVAEELATKLRKKAAEPPKTELDLAGADEANLDTGPKLEDQGARELLRLGTFAGFKYDKDIMLLLQGVPARYKLAASGDPRRVKVCVHGSGVESLFECVCPDRLVG